jgi:hypothetical protein
LSSVVAGITPYVFHRHGQLKRIIQRILEGNKLVLSSLFASNPFPDAPPKYARVAIYSFEPGMQYYIYFGGLSFTYCLLQYRCQQQLAQGSGGKLDFVVNKCRQQPASRISGINGHLHPISGTGMPFIFDESWTTKSLWPLHRSNSNSGRLLMW